MYQDDVLSGRLIITRWNSHLNMSAALFAVPVQLICLTFKAAPFQEVQPQ